MKTKWIKEFDEKFDGVYYGKDSDGNPNYPPEGFKDDVKLFISSLLDDQRKKVIKEMIGVINKKQ